MLANDVGSNTPAPADRSMAAALSRFPSAVTPYLVTATWNCTYRTPHANATQMDICCFWYVSRRILGTRSQPFCAGKAGGSWNDPLQ